MKSSSSIIFTCSTALLLLLASSVASASDSNSDKHYQDIAEQTSTFANGIPESTKYTHQSWKNNWDCKQHNSFPPDPSTPYWEYGPCDPYYYHRQYCPKGCITNNGYDTPYKAEETSSRRRLGSSNDFKKHKDLACRNNHGQKGTKNHDYKLHTNVSRDTCKNKCNKYSGTCYGYQYYSPGKECKVWIVPINENKLDRKYDVDCYIKKGGNNGGGNNNGNKNHNLCPSGCIVW